MNMNEESYLEEDTQLLLEATKYQSMGITPESLMCASPSEDEQGMCHYDDVSVPLHHHKMVQEEDYLATWMATTTTTVSTHATPAAPHEDHTARYATLCDSVNQFLQAMIEVSGGSTLAGHVFFPTEPMHVDVTTYVNALITVLDKDVVEMDPATVLAHACALLGKMRDRFPHVMIADGNVRRLLLCAVILSVKSLADRMYKTVFWSRWSTIPVREINTMEREMLSMLGYGITIPAKDLQQFGDLLRVPVMF